MVSKHAAMKGSDAVKVEWKKITRTEIVAPKGWNFVTVGCSEDGDMFTSQGREWMKCTHRLDCSCCVVIRRNEKEYKV